MHQAKITLEMGPLRKADYSISASPVPLTTRLGHMVSTLGKKFEEVVKVQSEHGAPDSDRPRESIADHPLEIAILPEQESSFNNIPE